MAALGSGLAERRISIDQVHARRSHNGSWIAELQLVTLEGAPDPRGISYIGLANERRTFGSLVPALESFELTNDPSGTLMLRFEAADTLGLLGTLLCALANISLYPVEMHIETRSGRAQDCLWLAGAASARPSAEARLALEHLMTRSITPA
jgi:hypothetical protein